LAFNYQSNNSFQPTLSLHAYTEDGKHVGMNYETKEKCPVQKRRTITISQHYELLKRAREYNKTDHFKEYMKQRAHIEPKQGEMKRYHGLERAKYWGLPKMNIQATMSAIVVKVKRFITMNSYGYQLES